ncbi:MAG: hypothetical protein ACR2KT_09405 [Methylocella sp.]|nr:MAG: hypothetical protein DLM71_09210 [Chloroflexota bacterium]
MRRGWKAWFLAIVTTFAIAPGAAAQARSPSKGIVHYWHVSGTLHRSFIRSLGHGGRHLYGLRAHGLFGSRRTRFADLVGDPDSGLGFYALPIHYRIGAWRNRLRNRRPPWQNPVLFAIAADAVRDNDWIPSNRGYRYGVFNPVDGAGTPFFGGYYGPAGDDEPPPFPFGRPYPY